MYSVGVGKNDFKKINNNDDSPKVEKVEETKKKTTRTKKTVEKDGD